MRYLVVISFLLLNVSSLFGQSITVEVSSNEVEVGERFMINYSFQGGDDLEMPSFSGFEVVRKGYSEGVQFSNGKISRIGTYSFTLIALQPGTYQLPPATLSAGGKKIKSPPVVIKVIDNGQTAPVQKGQQPMSSSPAPSEKTSVKDLILALAETDKKKAYVGEQLTLTYNILYRVSYNSLEEYKAPQYKGFLTQNIEVDENAPSQIRKFNGANYYDKILSKCALYGTFPGTFTIEPLHFRAVAMIPEYYPFMGSNTIEVPRDVILPTNKITLQILPLPEKGKPENFSGLVGKWDAERNLSSTKAQAGKVVKLTYNVTGVGDLKSVVFPDFNYPEEIDAFEPETKTIERVFENDQLGGIRTFEQSLVFREPGNYIIPEYTFSYFDIRSEQYITKTLPELRVEVIPSESAAQSDVTMDGNTFISDIQSGWQKEENQVLSKVLTGAGAAFPFLALALVAVYRRRGQKMRPKDISKASSIPDLGKLSKEEQYAELADYIIRELSPLANSDNPLTIRWWLSQYAEKQDAIALQYILSACDRARFSPLGAEPAADLLKQAVAIIERLRKQNPETV
jgi:hypothetical protein